MRRARRDPATAKENLLRRGVERSRTAEQNGSPSPQMMGQDQGPVANFEVFDGRSWQTVKPLFPNLYTAIIAPKHAILYGDHIQYSMFLGCEPFLCSGTLGLSHLRLVSMHGVATPETYLMVR